MECTSKNRTAVFTVNLIFTVLLVISMVYLSTQVMYQQQEIKNFRTKLQKVMGRNKRIHLGQNYESAHLIGHGNKITSKPPPGDVYRIISWKKQHMSGNMSYDNGYLTVKVDGIYFVYTQMYYFHRNNSYNGFDVYIDNKRILRAIYIYGNDNPHHTHYTGGVFEIRKGQRIWVGTIMTRTYFFNEFSSFFGAYMLHSLP